MKSRGSAFCETLSSQPPTRADVTQHVLVTGGAGFVGSHLCAELARQGHAPVAVDDLSNGDLRNVPAGVPFIRADLGEASQLKALDKYDFRAVYHLAAQSSNALSFRDPRADLIANQLATLNLLQYCEARELRRLVFTSSMSAYGQPAQIPTTESAPCRPGSFYGVHKLASELYLRAWADTHDLSWTVFRLYTTYGHGQNLSNTQQGLIKIYLGFVLREEPILVCGSLDRLRDCVHVSDVVEALMRALDAPQTAGRIYNVATGWPLTVRRIIDFILDEAGHDPATYPIVTGPADSGDPHVTHGDISALTADLGWAPRIPLEDGIRLTVRQYLEAR